MNNRSLENSAGDDAGELTLSELIDTLLQHLWLAFGIFAFVVGCGVAYTILATPIYRADALIQVEDRKASVLSGVQDIADALGGVASPVSGEIEILKSREVLNKAIRETQADISITVENRFPLIGTWLARRYEAEQGSSKIPFGLSQYAWGGEQLELVEFNVSEKGYGVPFIVEKNESGYTLLDQNGKALAQASLGKKVSFTFGGGTGSIAVAQLLGRTGVRFRVIREAPIRAYRQVLRNLSVTETGRQSNIIRLSYEDPNVTRAQALVNSIAKAYLTQNVERRSAEADKSLEFLQDQLPQIKRMMEDSENALNEFRTRTNTVSVDKGAENLLAQIVELERNRVSLQLKRDELAQRYHSTHPSIKAIETQLAEIQREASKLNEQVARLPSTQRDLLRLQRDAEVNTQLYIALLNNAQQLKIAKAGTIGNVRVIDFAITDDAPVAPKKALVVLGAMILGAILGLVGALTARILRPTIRDANEIERATGLVAYAAIPESDSQQKLDLKRGKGHVSHGVDGRPQLLATLSPADPAIESLRSLRTGMAFALMGASDKNVVITGATAELGKSFISANLSVLLATAGKKVLLIETDLRRPQLGRYFGYGPTIGLSDYLAGNAKLEQVLRKSINPNLDLLPSGQIPPNPGELLLSDRFGELLARFQDDYDHILIDSAPVLPVADTLAVVRHVSTTFIVVRSEKSTVGEVRDALRKLEAAGTSVKGIILNGVKKRRVGYGAAYKYYYGYGNQ